MREGVAQCQQHSHPSIGYFAVCIPVDTVSRAKKDLEMGFWTFRPREKWSESNNQRRGEGQKFSSLLLPVFYYYYFFSRRNPREILTLPVTANFTDALFKFCVHSNSKRRAGIFLLSHRRERLDQEFDEQNFDEVNENPFCSDFFLFKLNLQRAVCFCLPSRTLIIPSRLP